MTGWRLGYIAGPKHFITACGKLQSQVCCISYWPHWLCEAYIIFQDLVIVLRIFLAFLQNWFGLVRFALTLVQHMTFYFTLLNAVHFRGK